MNEYKTAGKIPSKPPQAVSLSLVGLLSHLSIRSRIFLLSGMLLLVLLAAVYTLHSTILTSSVALQNQTHVLNKLSQANATLRAFSEYKYWLFDRISGLLLADIDWLNESRYRLERAKTVLDNQLNVLSIFAPEEAAQIQDSLKALDTQTLDAAEAIIMGDHILGNLLIDDLRATFTSTDDLLSGIVQREASLAAVANQQAFTSMDFSLKASSLIFVGAIVFAVIMSLLVNRSIVLPLNQIVAAIRQLAEGRTPVVIPPARNDEIGSISRALSAFVDNTLARRKAEAALAESEARYRSLTNDVLDTVQVGISILDAEFKVVWVNQALEDYFGLRKHELIGQDSRQLIREQIQDVVEYPQSFAEKILTSFEKNTAIERFGCHVLPDGHRQERWLECWSLPIRTGLYVGGRICQYYDITARRQAEEALLQAQKMEAVGQLTGGAAHDFNNLLTIITGNLQMLEERLQEDPFLAKLVQAALKAASRGAELVHKLLVFSRRQALRPQPIDLNQLLGGMTELLHRTLGETIAITTRPGRDLWLALADAHQVETALLNLAVNARDAMPQGGRLTIETANTVLDENYAARETEVSPGDYVLLAVSDTGTGMPADLLKHAFEPFFTTKATGKGSGLGLSMVYGFVKQSSGHIKLYSEPDQGTTVKLYLPRAIAAAKQSVEPRSSPSVPLADGEAVLVVEDEPDVRELAVLFLTNLGYRTLAAGDGQAALALLEQQPVELLFADLVLPGGLSGPELAREARCRYPDLKVLFTSGYAKGAIIGQERLDPAIMLLSKPYQKADLARAVRRALEKSSI